MSSLVTSVGSFSWPSVVDPNTDIARQLVGNAYFRMQTELRIGMDDLDDTSQTNIVALEKLATDYLQSAATRQMLDKLARAL